MGVRIIVDSTVDVPAGIKNQLLTVPLSIAFGDEIYVDGVTISHKEFYEKLIECDVLPKTSQANPDAFMSVYDEITAADDEAVVLTVSAKLSGTCQSAMLAAQEYSNIHVVDTHSVAIGSGILAELALYYRARGMKAAEIAARLTEDRKNIRIVALLDTLEYLKKGGRISSAVAFAGGLLAIKPVVGVTDGDINILGKARGSRQGNNLLVQQIEIAGGVDFEKPVLLGYTGLSDHLLRKYVEESACLWQDSVEELPYTMIGSTIGTHVGPGAIAVAFFCQG